MEFVFRKVDDSCRHEPQNIEYEVVLDTRFKQSHEAQKIVKELNLKL